ncbi:MAG: V-type ATPase subunit [Oscillospiraceae bacterium]
MLRSSMKYGALRAKVLAMYGKLLSPEDWRRIGECSSVADIATFLRAQPGWSDAVSPLSASPSPSRLKAILRKKVFSEYEKLFCFAYLEDKKYLLFTLYRAEYNYVLDALCGLYADASTIKSFDATDFLRAHSSVNIAALESCRDFPSLLEAIRGSIFFAPLSRLPLNPETALPDYRSACILLENLYFKAIFTYVSKKYRGDGSKTLAEILGRSADMLNIISILRLQRFFPGSLPAADSLLVPVSLRLRPALLRALISADGESEAREILKKSPCEKYFKGLDVQKLDNLFDEAMASFCRNLLRSPEPSICIPQAYLTLREIECKRLARYIEAASYGLEAGNSFSD